MSMTNPVLAVPWTMEGQGAGGSRPHAGGSANGKWRTDNGQLKMTTTGSGQRLAGILIHAEAQRRKRDTTTEQQGSLEGQMVLAIARKP